MTSDELQQQEELGRKIAAALAPLGLSPATIQAMVAESVDDDDDDGKPVSADYWRRHANFKTELGLNATTFARAAGVAAYFEGQGK